MTLWSSPHPKESAALSLGQAQQGVESVKMKELADSSTVMPSSATSFASDGSEDAGFEDGSIDVDMGEEETESIQIDCIQTLTELEPMEGVDIQNGNDNDSPTMSDFKTAIPLPAPPVQVGSAYGGNQAYVNIQNALPKIIDDRPSSPMQFWGNSASDRRHSATRAPGDVGLNNIGNTCFMNSGLQCLLHTSPLVEFFVASDTFERTITSLVYQFHSLMKHAWFGYSGSIALNDFKMVLGNKYAQFKDCRQHDCQEFLAVLLDMLHEELKSKQKAVDAGMSAADSSVEVSYIEECTSDKASDNFVGSSSKDVNLSSQSTAEETQAVTVTDSTSEIEETQNNSSPKNPVCKRRKLENDEERSEAESETLNNDGEVHPSEDEVKRKTAKHEVETHAGSEAERNVEVQKAENESEEKVEAQIAENMAKEKVEVQMAENDEEEKIEFQVSVNEAEEKVEVQTVVNKTEDEVEVHMAENEAEEKGEVPKAENEAEGCSGSNQENISPVQKAHEYWEGYMKDNNTVIASTFQGMFKSAVTCSECSFNSETYEPFMYLSLPIPRVMEKQINATFISMKDRSTMKVDLTLHLIDTVEKLIQDVVKKVESAVDSKYVAAEIVNHRVARLLDEKLQLRHLSTNSRNIYVYELNDNFDDKYQSCETPVTATIVDSGFSVSSSLGARATTLHEDWETDESVNIKPTTSVSTSTSSTSTFQSFRAPVGGGVYDTSSSFCQGVSSSSDSAFVVPRNENFNRVQCNICLEDFAQSDLKQHRGCSCVLCEECLMKSVEHFKSDSNGNKKQDDSYVKCAVCLQTVECKRAFVSLEESAASSSPLEFITIPVIFRNEPCTDANNNASAWSPGLFSYPWLLRVPSHMDASELVEYVECINPVPEANHRILSVKSDGKSCGQCVFSSRCGGCEIPREGMISLNSCNSILISYSDLPSERMSEMQPSDMAIYNELTTSWQQYSRNDEPTIDIHDCLRTFSETEHLDEQNPWYCPRCKKNQRATKALSICKFPDYLIVYLKRFVFLDQSSNKLNNRLTFPVNDLDVSDYVSEGFGYNLGKYDLYSCVCHFGSASAGHYTAFAKNPITNQWHYFNDDTITERSPAESEHSSAYVLFYEKQGMARNIPTKYSGPLPELNSFSKISSYSADTQGIYLPSESIPSGPVRVDGEFVNEGNLQVDSTSPSFSFPHTSTEADLLSLEVDEGVGHETTQLVEIRENLGLSENDAIVVTSTSAAEDSSKIDLGFHSLGTQHTELSSSSTGGADSTSN